MNTSPEMECPLCGVYPSRPWVREIKYTCPSCRAPVVINEKSIPKGGGANVVCSHCRKTLQLPAKIWCPQCGNGLLDLRKIVQYISEENKVDLGLLTREAVVPALTSQDLEIMMNQMNKLKLF